MLCYTDAQFEIARIYQEQTKYSYVVAQLKSQYAAEVEDIISEPPSENPFTHIRNEFIRRLTLSDEQRVRQLLNVEEIGDCNLLKTLWLQRLPAYVQGILQSQADLLLPSLTELAAKIFDVNQISISNSVNSIQIMDNSQVTSLSLYQ